MDYYKFIPCFTYIPPADQEAPKLYAWNSRQLSQMPNQPAGSQHYITIHLGREWRSYHSLFSPICHRLPQAIQAMQQSKPLYWSP